MNEIQLKSLADNPALMEAVKTHILEQFEITVKQSEKSDEQLGQLFRAQLVGRELVEQAFREIERLANPSKETLGVNKAR